MHGTLSGPHETSQQDTQCRPPERLHKILLEISVPVSVKASLVASTWHYFQELRRGALAWCNMKDHLHLLYRAASLRRLRASIPKKSECATTLLVQAAALLL